MCVNEHNRRRKKMKKNILFTFITLFVLFSLAYGEWEYEMIDSAGSVGAYVKMLFDSQENRHVVYYDWDNGDVKYAYWDGTSWEIEVVDSNGDVGHFTSLALDADDYPHIAYYYDIDVNTGHLKYAHWNGSSWDIETVDSNQDCGTDTAIDIDSNGYPHISYADNANGHLKYARWDGSTWHLETVDNGSHVVFYGDMVLDTDDHAHICYRNNATGGLKYAEWDGNAWQIETVDNESTNGAFTSIVLDTDGYQHISYYYWPDSLKYARWDGTIWNIETVDGGGRHTSLALDANGYPHISHDEYTTSSLKYARWDGSSWQTETVDNSGYVGVSTALVLDNFSLPHIAYRDAGNGNLLYAHYVLDAAVIVQEHYRWRNDDGDEASATWKNFEDTGVIINSDENIRIRFDLSNRSNNQVADLTTANLQYSLDETVWENITTDASINHFVLSLSDHFADGDLAPSDFLTNETTTQASGVMYEITTNFGGNFPLETGFEYEWCIKPTENVQNTDYFFRINGTVTGNPQNNIFSNALVAEFMYEPALIFDPPTDLFVTEEGYVTWSAPSCRDLLGYNVYLDDEFISFTSNLFWQYEDLSNGQTYTAGVTAVYDDGVSEIIEIDFTYIGTSAEDNIETDTKLKNNYPNPFNPTTTISFSLKETGYVSIDIYNLKGQLVKTLVNQELERNDHKIIWDGKDNSDKSLGSGIYFYKMKNGIYTSTKKMILIK